MMNYFNPYQQMYQPATEMQGRVVNTFDEITANDVPMSAGYAIFPKADMSEVQIRRWTPQGTIDVRSFKPSEPIIAPATPQPSESRHDDIKGLFEALSDRLDRIEKAISNKRGKKNESNDNDDE